MNTLIHSWPDRQASNICLPWNSIALGLTLCVLSSTLFAQEKPANTVRDRLWTWAVDASYDWPAHEAGATPQKNRMTPVEGAVYLGTPNVMFIQYNGVPVAPFQQYYTPFKSLKQVYWTLSNNGNQIHELGPEQEHVYELVTDNPNITGLLLDDSSTEHSRRTRVTDPDQGDPMIYISGWHLARSSCTEIQTSNPTPSITWPISK